MPSPPAESPRVLEHLQKILDPLAFHPQHGDRGVEVIEEAACPRVLFLRGPAQHHHDALQVAHFFQFGDDLLHGESLKLRIERGQNQSNGPVVRELFQIGLEPVDVVGFQTMEGGNHPGLMKVSHRKRLQEIRPVRASST